MKLHFATVPVFHSQPAETELNQFLASRRVIAVEPSLIHDGPRSTWAVCVTYVDQGETSGVDSAGKRGKVDYRELLSEADFLLFSRLRTLRKELAERDAVPVYAVFTNEQLAEMVRLRVQSLAELGRLDGVGPARVEKYGQPFLDALRVDPGLQDLPSKEAERALP